MRPVGVAGVVCEYNPFHNGHAWMVEELRRRGASAVVCVMSGNYVQRAEPAIFPVQVRTQAALAAGADLVLRLPLPYCTASAEAFSRGAVGLLAALGCVDTVAFGAETADTSTLVNTAQMLLSADWQQQLKNRLAAGEPFVAARAAAAESLLPGAAEMLRRPNNILGIEYCKALVGALPAWVEKTRAAQGEENMPTAARMLPRPLALPRLGAGHDGAPQEGIASASWLRRLAAKQDIGAWASWVPASCMEIYTQAMRHGLALDAGRWQLAMLARLKGLAGKDFAQFTPAGEGLEMRMAAAAKEALTLQELYALAKTKRYPHSRVRRLALHAALDLQCGAPEVPPFIQVLGAGGRGLQLLKQAKGRALLPVSTSLAKLAKTSPEAEAVIKAEAAAGDLYAFCQIRPEGGGGEYTRPAVLV